MRAFTSGTLPAFKRGCLCGIALAAGGWAGEGGGRRLASDLRRLRAALTAGRAV